MTQPAPRPDRLPEQEERAAPGKRKENYRYVSARQRRFTLFLLVITLLMALLVFGFAALLLFRPDVAENIVLIAGDRAGTRTQEALQRSAAATATAEAFLQTQTSLDLTANAALLSATRAAEIEAQGGTREADLAATQAAFEETRVAVEQAGAEANLRLTSISVAASQTAIAFDSELQGTLVALDISEAQEAINQTATQDAINLIGTQSALDATATQSALNFNITRTAIAVDATRTADALERGDSGLTETTAPPATATPLASATQAPTITASPTITLTPTPAVSATPTPPGIPALETRFNEIAGWNGSLSAWETGSGLRAADANAWLLTRENHFSTYLYEVWFSPGQRGEHVFWLNVQPAGSHSVALALEWDGAHIARAELIYFSLNEGDALYDTLPILPFEGLDIPPLDADTLYYLRAEVRGNQFVFSVNDVVLAGDNVIALQDASTEGALGFALPVGAVVQYVRVTPLG